MEEQRWRGDEGKERAQRLNWMDLCMVGGTAVVERIHWQAVQTYIRCADSQLGLLPHDIWNGIGGVLFSRGLLIPKRFPYGIVRELTKVAFLSLEGLKIRKLTMFKSCNIVWYCSWSDTQVNEGENTHDNWNIFNILLQWNNTLTL